MALTRMLVFLLVILLPLAAGAQAPYRANAPLSGSIRSWGHFGMIGLMDAWKKGFHQYHPDVVFEYHLVNTALGMPGLATGVADIGLIGREPYRVELMAYQHYHGRAPFMMEFGTGAYLGSSFPPVIWVHRDNPISQLTFEQLDRIFGAERNGGWHRNQMHWNHDAARGGGRKISTWGQLGLSGEWKHRPIQPIGFVAGPRSGVAQFMGMHVFQGSQKWAENLYEVWYEQQSDGRILDLNTVMVNEIASNLGAIGYGRPKAQTEMVKPIALARTGNGPFVQASEQTVADRDYPLARPVYIYANIDADGKLKPHIAEFLHYVLSVEGQQAIREEGSYRALTQDDLARQIELLVNRSVPPLRPAVIH